MAFGRTTTATRLDFGCASGQCTNGMETGTSDDYDVLFSTISHLSLELEGILDTPAWLSQQAISP